MSFTENLYLKRMIQKLQEENAQLKNRVKMLREAAEPPLFPPSEPNQPQPQPAPEPFIPPQDPRPTRPLPGVMSNVPSTVPDEVVRRFLGAKNGATFTENGVTYTYRKINGESYIYSGDVWWRLVDGEWKLFG